MASSMFASMFEIWAQRLVIKTRWKTEHLDLKGSCFETPAAL